MKKSLQFLHNPQADSAAAIRKNLLSDSSLQALVTDLYGVNTEARAQAELILST